jgi:putative ubiquitin-RnfH superfamily antitoxin RatB of RatAB toxin-antitoxin module
MADEFPVSVVYATPDMEVCLPVQLTAGSTIADAIRASGLAGNVPGIDVAALKAGLWGKLKPPATILREGDRVEVYRPLKADPNTARQHRVAKKRAAAGK